MEPRMEDQPRMEPRMEDQPRSWTCFLDIFRRFRPQQASSSWFSSGLHVQTAASSLDLPVSEATSKAAVFDLMTIAKHTINTILDTLGENDFVNIIAYTDYVRYVEPCFKGTLVQADLDTREHFKLLVDELHVKGEAKIKNALKEAFKILNQVRVNGQGSMCNQAIMLITDGAMEDFESVFEEFNWPDRRVRTSSTSSQSAITIQTQNVVQTSRSGSRGESQMLTRCELVCFCVQVRVFTYLIGREMTFAQNTKWIACNNKGYYTHISTLADVQENVMEYLHVLSRPMVINHDHDIIWTEAYMDTVLFTTKAQSLLLMTSVAMPVFSKKKETLSHGILLGVVGSDIPLMEVIKLAPRYTLGPHGYAFLITNNGYILAHPDLRPLYKDGKKLKAKPNYNSVDLTEVEWEDTEDTLRTAMVKGQTGSLSLSVRASVDKAKRPLFLINEYFYTNIDDTPFSFGMVLTKGHGKLFFIGNVSVEEGTSSHNALQHRRRRLLMVKDCCLQVCTISPPQTSASPPNGLTVKQTSTRVIANTLSFRQPSATCRARNRTWSVMRCCCSSCCLTPWSRLRWRPTGTP
ncbi:unnamed protein product [Tetraodon nigroviridis]|uniref:(spotted green pufferfish) hypothetical protein n=1 Tax=Tetraodon nigroviridis TaxID=99883 RepID=Q4T3M0_TETNG|nr:unnamed protein product [Tetraodon nigroviridis]